VIRIDDEQYWLYTAVKLSTNHLLHIRIFLMHATALTQIFPPELRVKHNVERVCFSSIAQPTTKLRSTERASDFSINPTEIGIALNVASRGKTTNLIVQQLFQPRRTSNC
jgi:transposase-like protein